MESTKEQNPMSGAPVRLICNPVSGGLKHEPEEIYELLKDLDPELVVTKDKGDATKLAREWRSGLLVVAGGDGTLNETIIGLGEAGFPGNVTLAVLPLGTGNDFTQTIKMPPGPEKAAGVIRDGAVRIFDAVHIISSGIGERYFINVATGGLGMEISQAADDPKLKRRWGKLSYLRASLEAAGDGVARDVRLTLDGKPRDLRAVNISVGNCRYTGGGWPAAPRANPEDGLLDVVVVGEVTASELLSLTPKALASADYLDDEGVFFARASSLSVEADPGIGFTADGEVIGEEPVEFTVVPKAVKVVVGPEYSARPGG